MLLLLSNLPSELCLGFVWRLSAAAAAVKPSLGALPGLCVEAEHCCCCQTLPLNFAWVVCGG